MGRTTIPYLAPAATRRTVKAQGGAERNPGVSPHIAPRPNGALERHHSFERRVITL